MSSGVGTGFQNSSATIVIPFSSTPVFDGSQGILFVMTLTGNVTSSTFINGFDAQRYTFIIKQDSNGLHSFAWPNIVKGAVTIPITALANTAAVQHFTYEATSGNLYSTSVGLLNL